MLDRVRIVLVRPIRPGNVGAAARAMANMGLTDLVIVRPACDLRDEAAIGFAARARPLLESARLVDSIPGALAGCVLSFAATGKGGLYRRQASVTPVQAAALAFERLQAAPPASGQAGQRYPVAIAFGPEDRGLLRAEVLHFDRVVEIPADADYPVLNLAAAVMVMCYELRRTCLALQEASRHEGTQARRKAPGTREQQKAPGHELGDPPATAEHREILFERLFSALERVGFFSRQQTSEHLRFAIRRVLGRVDMTVNEVDVLIGAASQIHWYCDQSNQSRGRNESAR